MTLKGPVRSEDEKKVVEAKAIEVAGAGHVTNESVWRADNREAEGLTSASSPWPHRDELSMKEQHMENKKSRSFWYLSRRVGGAERGVDALVRRDPFRTLTCRC